MNKQKIYTGYVYKITITDSNHKNPIYIGRTINTSKRENEHKRYNTNSTKPLYIEMSKSQCREKKFANFKFEVIDSVIESSIELADNVLGELEKYYIEFYNSFETGLNDTKGGEKSNWGKECSDATKQRMSESQKGNNNSYGKTLSDETKKKISESLKCDKHPNYGKTGVQSPMYGRQYSDEHKKNMSAAQSGEKNHNYGKPKSDDMLQKRSITRTINTLTKIINGSEISYPTIKKYKQYIDEFNLTGNIQYLEELLQQKK